MCILQHPKLEFALNAEAAELFCDKSSDRYKQRTAAVAGMLTYMHVFVCFCVGVCCGVYVC